MTIVIHGATVATVDADDTVIYDGAVAVEGDRIASVGNSREVLARYPQAEKIDATGKAIMPGFANVHTHLHMTLARGIYEDLSPPHRPPFTSGLAPLPVPELSPDELSALVPLGALEAIRSGTTAVARGCDGDRELCEVSADTGLRFLLSRTGLGQGQGHYRRPRPFRGRRSAR